MRMLPYYWEFALLAGVALLTGVTLLRLEKIITLPRRAANAYGSCSTSGSLQARVAKERVICVVVLFFLLLYTFVS